MTGGNTFLKRQSREGLSGEKGTGAYLATNSASWGSLHHHHHPYSGLWLLLYDLVRHWFVLEPGVFIQDRLHSETLDVYVIQVKDLNHVRWPQENFKCNRGWL